MLGWCATHYTITGDAQEVKALYELMHRLEEQEKLTLQSNFGTTQLGGLVDALGEDWHSVQCNGYWDRLNFDGGVLTFCTETEGTACNEVFELVRRKFPSLTYYYLAENPENGYFCTNDAEGKYYPERYFVNIWTDKDDCYTEYFTDMASICACLEKISGVPVRSEQDIKSLEKRWQDDNYDAFICVHEFTVYGDKR